MHAKALAGDQTDVSDEDAIGLKRFVAVTAANAAEGVDDNRAILISKRDSSQAPNQQVLWAAEVVKEDAAGRLYRHGGAPQYANKSHSHMATFCSEDQVASDLQQQESHERRADRPAPANAVETTVT